MSAPADLAAQLDRLPAARVLVVGDVMLDRFIYGQVSRISPEGPIPILQIEREATMLGGAGNVLRNITALGAQASLVAVVGDDDGGRRVAALIAQSGAADGRLVTVPGRATTLKDRFIAAGQQLLRSDREDPAALPAKSQADILAAVQALLPQSGALILSDYGKGVLTPESIAALIAAARAAGCAVVADPKGRDFARYRGADVITPNRRELEEASGLPVRDDAEAAAAAQAVIDQAGVTAVLATRGAAGMSLVSADAPPEHLSAEAQEVFDVSGAGDTVAAVLAAALAAGIGRLAAARLANQAAGIVVRKVGTAVVHGSELRQALHASDRQAAENKVLARAATLDRVQQWRQAGLRVGFTNGCFDLLHPGHVSLLAQAKRACDRLIVGLNSDVSVRLLKGAGRPVQSEAARAVVLGSLAHVDGVVIFNEETPRALIEAIRPDVLVKGADYSVDTVVGADLVQGYGGQVVLAELTPGHSTSGTIEKLAE